RWRSRTPGTRTGRATRRAPVPRPRRQRRRRRVRHRGSAVTVGTTARLYARRRAAPGRTLDAGLGVRRRPPRRPRRVALLRPLHAADALGRRAREPPGGADRDARPGTDVP